MCLRTCTENCQFFCQHRFSHCVPQVRQSPGLCADAFNTCPSHTGDSCPAYHRNVCIQCYLIHWVGTSCQQPPANTLNGALFCEVFAVRRLLSPSPCLPIRLDFVTPTAPNSRSSEEVVLSAVKSTHCLHFTMMRSVSRCGSSIISTGASRCLSICQHSLTRHLQEVHKSS